MFLSQTEQLHLFSASLMPLPCEVKLKQWTDYMRPLWTWGWQRLLPFIPLWLQFTLKSKLWLGFRWNKLCICVIWPVCATHSYTYMFESASAHKNEITCMHIRYWSDLGIVTYEYGLDKYFHQLYITPWLWEQQLCFMYTSEIKWLYIGIFL